MAAVNTLGWLSKEIKERNRQHILWLGEAEPGAELHRTALDLLWSNSPYFSNLFRQATVSFCYLYESMTSWRTRRNPE